jgi:hypothetical protein
MAELVDALVSGTSGRKVVQVRFLFWAHRKGLFLLSFKVCPDGGTGRRAWLRAMSTFVGAGSIPVLGTVKAGVLMYMPAFLIHCFMRFVFFPDM